MPSLAGTRCARLLAAAAGIGLAGGLALSAGPARAQQPAAAVVAAVLQGLDKTTARVSTFEAPIDGVARFGTLEITARACRKKPPTETPESAAFLEIIDVRPDSPAVRVFTGWMFASSPALSAMEHPVYDVWVVDCRSTAPGDQNEAAAAAPAAQGQAQAAHGQAAVPAAEDAAMPDDSEAESIPADR